VPIRRRGNCCGSGKIPRIVSIKKIRTFLKLVDESATTKKYEIELGFNKRTLDTHLKKIVKYRGILMAFEEIRALLASGEIHEHKQAELQKLRRKLRAIEDIDEI